MLDCIPYDDTHLIVNPETQYSTNEGQKISVVEHSQGLNIREQGDVAYNSCIYTGFI